MALICVAEPTLGITLNAKELNIQTAIARDHLMNGYSITATSVSYNVEEETITLEFPQALHAGSSWILDIAYIGLVNDKLNGFYRSVYTDADNNVHQLTTTQFQSTHARRAFPCWDEPAIKATFTLTLVAPQGMTCLSNMSVQSTTLLENGMQEVTFLKTPIMATYLLAWMIGDFHYIEAYSSGEFNAGRVQCRVYAPVGLADQGHYSLDLAVKSVEYFSRLFNIPYPLPKLDLVAVPDFAPGAMENWGLIAFRTYALLIEEYGSQDRKQEIAATVVHEISHQWFGNLVTMEWWSDLWLFEGFATHLAYIVVDDLFPGWDIWSEFVKRIQEVLKHDSLRTSHPVEVGVANPSEITQIFDEISYMKGASILRMLNAWLGQDLLLLGIRKFMHRYMWSNANTEDLWATLAEESKLDVPGFMNKWTRQTGYPVLSITELGESTVLVRQNLFLSTGDVRQEEDTLVWPVPLALVTASDPTPRNIMMDTKEMVLKVDTTQWYKFNMGQTGFYRVSYPPKALDLLGQTFGTDQLNAANRVGLLTDAAALVASGNAPTSSFLTLLKYFEDEDNYMVWAEVSLRLQELLAVWLEQPAPIMDGLKEVQRRLFTKIVKRLGWDFPEGEDPSTGNLRAVAIRFAGRAGDPETTQGAEEYDAIVNYYRETFIPAEKVVALSVLGYGNSTELVRRTLAFAMSPEVRTQDILSAIATLRSSVVGRAELWNFMRHHWDVLYERHFGDIGFLDYLVSLSIESFSTLERYQEVQAFFANKDTSAYDRILATCLEGIRMNILWLERDCKDVEQWLIVNGYLAGHTRFETQDNGLSSTIVSTSDTAALVAASDVEVGNRSQSQIIAERHDIIHGRTDEATLMTEIMTMATSAPFGVRPYQQDSIHGQQATLITTHTNLIDISQTFDSHSSQLQQLQQESPLQHRQQQQQQQHHGHQVHMHGQPSRPQEQRPRTLEREMELLSMSGDYEF
ncbi:Aminopeptidase 2 mitochondrial [Mortierella sp. GBA30]|nr:Aminopeptidase 2 mitochondrial [Mortierella sp. GBA30]